jgi:multiple sugar transport system substrate-binding protein
MYSNGGTVIGEDGEAALDSPENRETLTFFKELAGFAPEGIANVGEPEAVSAFTAGQVAMLLTGSWQQDTMNQRVDFDWRIAVPPAPEGKSFVGALGGWNYAINKNSQNKEAAFKLIEFLTTNKEVQKTINSLTPGMKEAGEEFVRERRKQPEVILETLNSGRPRPISPVYPQVSDIEQAMVQAIWAGTPVEQALADAQTQIADLLATSA